MAKQSSSLAHPTTAIASGKIRTFRLDEENELRFEVPSDVNGVTLVLESGSAEMFGVELAHNRTYVLRPGFNGAVFTWHGATILLNEASGDEALRNNGAGGHNSKINDNSNTNNGTLSTATSTTATIMPTTSSALSDAATSALGNNITTNAGPVLPNTTTAGTATVGATATAGTAGTTSTAAGGPSKVMAYTASNTPMPSYINAHAVLQSKRDMAKSAGIPGPRAVVVGAKDSGKTTVVQTLASYCIKANGHAVIVDADPSASGIIGVIPGSISLSAASHLDLDTSTSGIVHERIMSFMLGHTSPGQNVKMSQAVYTSMGKYLDEALSNRSFQPYVGCIVDTCGDVDDTNGIQSLLDIVKALSADVVFVIGSERLFASVRTTLDSSPTETVLLNKSGGVVSRDHATKLALQSAKVKEYFYGLDHFFNPFSSMMDFDQVAVFKIGGVISQLSDSLLPVGAESSLDPLKPVKLTSLHDLLHKILGVSQAEREEDVGKAPLYGFVHVVRVNVERNTMMVLAPSPGKVPGRFFVAGDMKWIE